MYGVKICRPEWKTQVEDIVARLRAGDLRALAQAITLVEQRTPERVPLLKALFPVTGHAKILGITGAPGSGKSTLVCQLACEYRRRGKNIGIIAVDPTSPFSGGALLGDRIRMQTLSGDPGVFMRSMANRGKLGGLAPATTEVAAVLDASGRDYVLIETVGTGQDEFEIVGVADALAVVLVPGMSDSIQANKAGLMEVADIFVINKSDHEGADRVEQEVREAMSFGLRSDEWRLPIVKTVATTGAGTEELLEAVEQYYAFLRARNLLQKKAIEKWRVRLTAMLREDLLERFCTAECAMLFDAYAQSVATREIDPYTVIEQLLDRYKPPPASHQAGLRGL